MFTKHHGLLHVRKVLREGVTSSRREEVSRKPDSPCSALSWRRSRWRPPRRPGLDGSQQQAAVVSNWNSIAQAETVLLRPTAHGQMRGIAMVQGAVYDAVNAIDRSRKPYLLDLKAVRVGRRASQDAAAATAAYRVLLAITPTTRHEGLGTAYQATLAAIPDGPSRAGRCPGRRGRRGGDDCRSSERRVHGCVYANHWHRSRQVEADRVADHAGVRSRRLGRQT